MVWGIILAFVIGMAYGFFKKGQQDKGGIFKTGVIWGLIIAAVLAVLGWAFDMSASGIGSDFVGFVISFVIMVAIFVGGVLVGDWIEGRQATA